MNATELAEQFRTIANELRHQADRDIGADLLKQWLIKFLESFHKVLYENSEKFGYSPTDAKPASSVEFVCRWLRVERVKLFPDVRFRIDFEGGHRFTHNEAERVTHYGAYCRWLAGLLDRFSESIESSLALRPYCPNGPILKWRKIDSPLAGLQIVREAEQGKKYEAEPNAVSKKRKRKPMTLTKHEEQAVEMYREGIMPTEIDSIMLGTRGAECRKYGKKKPEDWYGGHAETLVARPSIKAQRQNQSES